MNSLININRITKVSYMFGIACLLVGIMFPFVTQTGKAAIAQNSVCGTGYTAKDESAPFEYNGGKTIVKAIVKAGDGCFKLKIDDPSDGCYKANGLGTNSVKVKMVGEEGPSCQAISHVLFFEGEVETPETPTDPPPTEVTPTEPTPTDPTPTDPTPTDPTPTDPTPTDPTPTDPTPTQPTETVTPTETETPTDSPETVTPTDPQETPTPTDPPETPKETDPPKEKKTSTPPPTLAQPTPMEGTPQVLIPQTGVDLSSSHQVFGSQFFLLLGLTFVGIGMVFHGFSKRRSRNETRD